MLRNRLFDVGHENMLKVVAILFIRRRLLHLIHILFIYVDRWLLLLFFGVIYIQIIDLNW